MMRWDYVVLVLAAETLLLVGFSQAEKESGNRVLVILGIGWGLALGIGRWLQ